MSGLWSALTDRAAATPTASAARSYRHGIWNVTTWAGLRDDALAVGAALRARGVSDGDVVAILATNQVASVTAEFGVLGIGAVALVLDPAAASASVIESMTSHRAVAAIVGDEEQFDKIEEANPPVSLRVVAVIETRGLRYLDDADADAEGRVVSFANLLERGRAHPATPAGAIDPSGIGAILADKAVDHATLLRRGTELAQRLRLRPSDASFAATAFAEPTAHDVLTASVVSGSPLHFGRRAARLLVDLRAVRPALLHAPGQVLNAMKADADNRAAQTKGLKRRAYAAGIRRGASRVGGRNGDRPVMLMAGAVLAVIALAYSGVVTDKNPTVRVIVPFIALVVLIVGAALAGLLTLRPVRNRYGIGRARAVMTADRQMSDEAAAWFGALGVPVQYVLDDATAPTRTGA